MWENESWTIVWEKVPAHEGVLQNEWADRLAKEGARRADELTSPSKPEFFDTVFPAFVQKARAQRASQQTAQRAGQQAKRDARPQQTAQRARPQHGAQRARPQKTA